jgi:hypothetical protein
MTNEFYKEINITPNIYASLGQISALQTVLKETEQINKMIKIDDEQLLLLNEANGGMGITDKQRGYLWYLISTKSWTKLAVVLNNLGFKIYE